MMTRGGTVLQGFIGVILFAVGAGMGGAVLHTLGQARAMSAWREVPAKVTACDLQVRRGNKGGKTYRVTARYTYEVDGVRHTGDRVSLHRGADNIGGYHRRKHAELRQDMATGTPTVCRVDPNRPEKAILDPKPRPELLAMFELIALVLIAAGLGIGISALPAGRGLAGAVDAAAGRGGIVMQGAGRHRAALASALAGTSFVAVCLWETLPLFGWQHMPWFLALPPVVAAIPVAVAVSMLLRHRKHGVSVLEMSPLPGRPGGAVNGTVRIPAVVEAADGFDLTLQCVHQYSVRRGKNRQSHRDVLWEDARRLEGGGRAFGQETLLPVRFTLPADKPITTAALGRDGYAWKLTVSAALPGLDYQAVFDVPVAHDATLLNPRP